MIIYTNDSNPAALKLVIAANFSHENVEIKVLNLKDVSGNEPCRLPYLAIDEKPHVFSSNAAALHLYPGLCAEEHLSWLELEVTQLTPLLAHTFGSNKSESSFKAQLLDLLHFIDSSLKQGYITGPEVSVIDVCLWSSLCVEGVLWGPDGGLIGSTDFQNIRRWFQAMKQLPEVRAALDKFPLASFNYRALLGGSAMTCTLPSAGDRPDNVPSIESPSHVGDSVSPEEIANAIESWELSLLPAKAEAKTVLPVAGEKNVLVTSALPYVNNVPHLGNIIGCVLSADIFARYCRLSGYNTLYISGTDEYGTATETKALAERTTPKQICDQYFEIHNGIYRWFGIGFDYFGRTTTQEQTDIAQDMFLKLISSGLIATQIVEQLLCQKCERFLADRFVEGVCPHPGCGYEDARGDQCDGCGKLVNATELIKPRCKVCNTKPVLRDSKQFFLDLPKIEPKLKNWIDSSEQGWTHNARVITRAWIKEGLKPRCITRDLKWGIPVPVKGFEDKVFYVWFDAPIGYISMTSRYTKEWKKWWQPQDENTTVTLYQFMAKDNVPFHSVMFPATLIGVDEGHTMVSHIMATEYLNYEDGKFSKSRGTGVFGNDAQETGIPADIWRFYLASARPEGQDSSFSWNDLVARNNSELLNNLGNFVNRALVFAEKNFDCVIPPMKLNNDDHVLLALCNREVQGYVSCLEKAKLRDGIKHLLSISRHGNQYMQSQQPWVLLKGTDDQKHRAGTVIGLSCNLTCTLATLLHPYMPQTSRTLFQQLATSMGRLNPKKPVVSIMLQPGHKLGKPSPLFAKIEQATVDQLKNKYKGLQQEGPVKNGPVYEKVAVLPEVAKSAADLETEIAEQGEKVRLLKTSGAEKVVWQPEVTLLLNLKKQFAILSGTPVEAKPKGKTKNK